MNTNHCFHQGVWRLPLATGVWRTRLRTIGRRLAAWLVLPGMLWGLQPLAQAQIPVTDGALIGVQQAFQQMSEQAMKEYLGKEIIQNQLGDNVIKQYLGDNVITQQLGENTIKKYLGEDAIKSYLGDNVITKGLGKQIIGETNPQSGAAQNMIGKLSTSQASDNDRSFSEIQTTAPKLLGDQREASFRLYEDNTETFFGKDTAPNCPDKGTQQLIDNCKRARNIMATQLQEIQNISKALEARNRALQDMMKQTDYSTQTELLQKQYVMNTMQAIIANDQMRLQAALAAYQNMRSVYQEKYNEALQSRQTGKGTDTTDATLQAQRAMGVATATGAFAATKGTLNSTWQSGIFKDRASVAEVLARLRKP